jgi:hypothetical protein
MLRRLLPLTLLGFFLAGCWEVLTHQESETVWMAWDGSLDVSPATLQLTAAAGELATGAITLSETSGKAGVEMELTVEGTGAEHVTLTPGEFTVGVTPAGSLTVQVQFQAPGDTVEYAPELVITTTGSPAEIRVPLQLSST